MSLTHPAPGARRNPRQSEANLTERVLAAALVQAREAELASDMDPASALAAAVELVAEYLG